jgi:[acyl-carrier-protein] S-malonyltransferase
MGVTLIFPGQGSQYVGMGKNLWDEAEFKDYFTRADKIIPISSLCLNGPEDQLKLTEFTQPAIVTHSIALFNKLQNILRQRNIKIDRVLGHSVGEYSALVAAGVLKFEDAIHCVHLRGKYMQEAVAVGMGKMYAILRVPANIVAEACLAVSTSEQKVMPANYNEPGQIVISGHSGACDAAVEWLKNNYAGKQMAIPLQVSAPFHSQLMLPAEKKLADVLTNVEFKSNEIPYIANIDAKEYATGTDADIIRENLIKQVCGSVLWYQSLEQLDENSVFIEVGPGKVLTGLNKKIKSTFKTFTLDSDNAFENIEGFFNECNL